MKILVLYDGDSPSSLSLSIRRRIEAVSLQAGHAVAAHALRKGEIPPCTGCLSCLTKHPDVCVHQKSFSGIAADARTSALVIFLTRVVFGTFSSAVKNVVDRGGLIIGGNGSRTQIIIGYGEGASEDEKKTFVDITARHRGTADIVHLHMKERVEAYFAEEGGTGDTASGTPWGRIEDMILQGRSA
jgi:multimeric flavodoxin WrbA